MRDFLSTRLADIPLERWLLGVAWIAVAFVLGKLVAWFASKVLKSLAARTKNRLDDVFLAFAEKPLVLLLTLGGFRLGIEALELPGEAGGTATRIFGILMVAAIAWAVARVVDRVFEVYLIPFADKTESALDDQLLPIGRKGAKAGIWTVAILLAIKGAGYDVGALLAGLGIGGVAVALAAKDTLSNFFGSMAVFIDRPFRLNDRIKVAGFDGNVAEIGLRTSRIRTLEGRLVTLPNSIFGSSPIENVSSEPAAKVTGTLDLARSAGAEGAARAAAAVKEALADLPGLGEEGQAGVSAISELGIRLTYVFFVRKEAPYLDTVSAAHLAILGAIEREGLELAPPRMAAPR